jgi:CTP synthase
MLSEKLDEVVLDHFHLDHKSAPDMKEWNVFVDHFKNPKHEVEIGLVGKYVELHDSYKSITEAFIHAGATNETKVKVRWVHSGSISEENIEKKLGGLDGILVAPGFGERGIEGKIDAVEYARVNKIPFFGICLGMQMAVIEFGRNVLGYETAQTTEIEEGTSCPVINLMDEQKNITNMGGTMRLGAWKCELVEGTIASEVYEDKIISERHRHRYEFNNEYKKEYEDAGMKASGFNPDTGLVEIVEIENHPWFVGVQFHPEYKSTVMRPHPLFVNFVKASLEHSLK